MFINQIIIDIPVHIKTQTGQFYTIYCQISDRIKTVKEYIYQLNGTPVKRLLFNGKSLRDTETLHDNKIQADDILDVALAESDSSSSSSNESQISIQNISGKSHYIDVIEHK
jgi:hypothetical protein